MIYENWRVLTRFHEATEKDSTSSPFPLDPRFVNYSQDSSRAGRKT